MLLFICGAAFSLLAPADLRAQSIAAYRTETEITINGKLNESAWREADSYETFYQFEPEYGAPSSFGTSVRVLYDERTLYFGFECLDPDPERITAKVTKRDGELPKDDGVVLLLDTFCDRNNAYIFTVNPLGTQKDGKIADNGGIIDFKWDETWYAVCRTHDRGWTAEIGIPFASLKYDANGSTWGFNAGRRIVRNLEKSFICRDLTAVHRVSQFGEIRDLQLGELAFRHYAVLPYLQAQLQESEKPEGDIGLDVRFTPITHLGFEATLNPDFATIEADVEKVNLTRYELQYPEKRPFFLEGAENYDTQIKQFYSRRIGEIPWGAKISGKMRSWKVHGLITQSDPASAGASVAPGENALYTVFRVNREMKKGSNVGFIGANRRYRERNAGSVGAAATLFFSNSLSMVSQLIKTHGPVEDGTWTGFVRPSYDTQFSHAHLRYSFYGEGVLENINAAGFVRDDDRREIETNVKHIFWINRRGLKSLEPNLVYNRYWSQRGAQRSELSCAELITRFFKKWSYTVSYEDEFKARYLPFFEKDFSNYLFGNRLEYDDKKGVTLYLSYASGYNYDRDLEKISGGAQVTIFKGWNAEYYFDKHWFSPAGPNDNSWIHYLRTSYYLTTDLYCKLFYQTKYLCPERWAASDFDLLRNTVQLVFVWRFLPPFGSLQLAYQEGSTRHTELEGQAKTFFLKFSWIFYK